MRKKYFALILPACAATALLTYGIINRHLLISIASAALLVWLVYRLYKYVTLIHTEVHEFVNAARYKDFARRYNVTGAPREITTLRQGFNFVNDAMQAMAAEKEQQYHYLTKVLELVNTGIVAFDSHSNEILWSNEAFMKMCHVPQFKNLDYINLRNGSLYTMLHHIHGSQPTVADVEINGRKQQFMFSSARFASPPRQVKIVAIQNLQHTLDNTQGEAWRKLLSVMTHEIMNSIAPISSLAATMHTSMDEPSSHLDIKQGLEAIKRRSDGLLKFANVYRNLNRVNAIQTKPMYISQLMESIETLMLPLCTAKGITLETTLHNTSLQISGDLPLLEQVLINIITNAIEAIVSSNSGTIHIIANSQNQLVTIAVHDNGVGISTDELDNIFVPFFTTKHNGSGIGLSLSKQIMLMHHGNIYASSEQGHGTTFTLEFPQLSY